MFNEFIKELREKEITITFSEGKLQYSGPEQFIDAEMIEKLRKYKAKLFKLYWPFECYNMMPINTEGSDIPFTLLHAGKAIYPLSEYFGRNQPLYGFFDEGSEGEKIKYKNVESFAAEYLNQIQKIMPSGPYLLGGFSFGGILSYEIALQIQRQGYEVPVLVLIDCKIPYYLRKSDKSPFLIKFIKKTYHFFEDIYYWFYHRIRNIFYEMFVILKMEIPVNFRKPYIIWTYIKLVKKYKPAERFKGDILLFKTESNNHPDKYLGWEYLCDNIEVIDITGNHNTMYESEEVLSVIREKMKDVFQKVNKTYQNR